MNLDTYEREGRHAYAGLARTVASILEKIAQEQAEFRVQQVQHRAKGVASLRNKLIDRNVLDTSEIAREIKDLAGVRVVLYTNADVARFISSGVISDNFEVDWNRTKFHYPMKDPTADDGFISYNYVVQLMPNRLALPEFAAMRGLSCEIQVQTTLDHAWSEMAHDTIYKPPLPGFGATAMKSVSDRMAEIMQKYLRPAGFEFQKVAADVRAFENARAIAEQDPIKKIADAVDNNERLVRIKEFAKTLAYYDDVVARAPEFQHAMVSAVKAARATPTTPRIVEGVAFKGVSLAQIVNEALGVIDRLRNASEEAIDGTFRALAELFPGASDEERQRLDTSLERLAKHDLDIWRVRGPLVERRLVTAIQALDSSARQVLAELAVSVLRHVLHTDLTTESSTYNTFTIHMGAVVASEEYLALRRDALTLLEEMVVAAERPADLRRILQAFMAAGRLPDHGTITGELLGAVLADGLRTVRFMTAHVANLPYEIRQEYEHDLLWRYRHNSTLPADLTTSPELESARQELQSAILAFRDAANTDREFVIFKTLVGYESVFPVEWEDKGLDVQGQAAYRSAAIADLVSGVDANNFDRWLKILHRCATSDAMGGDGGAGLRSFLVELGRSKPDLLQRLLMNLDQSLAGFVRTILRGLEAGSQESVAEAWMRARIASCEDLDQIVLYLEVSNAPYPGLLAAACRAAIEAGDDRAVALAMGVSARRYAEAPEHMVGIFLDGLRHFTKKRSSVWVDQVWYRARRGDFVDHLSAAERLRMLNCLVHMPRLDFHAEELLRGIVAPDPTQLLPFFRKRLENEGIDDSVARFEAIPFEFHSLKEAFAPIASETVAAVREWFDADGDTAFQYRGGALVARAFPQFELVHSPLERLVQRAGDGDLEFVLRVLMNYEGKAVILPLCREIVARLDLESPLLRTIDIVLDQSGVVSGEFGLVEQHQQRKAEIAAWLEDSSPSVRAFAVQRSRRLDLRTAADKRRALEELELRKRQYGE